MEDFFLRAVTAATVIASFGLYHLLNGARGRVHVLMTSADRAIPFVPMFSVPYVLYLPFLFVTVLYGILVTPQWKAVAAAALLLQIISSAIYAVWQTHVPRPDVGPGTFENLTRFVYRHDRPYNCFPSLHVAHSAACFFWMASFFPALALPLGGLALAIILSTMFIKQHAIVDVAGGLALAAAGVSVALRFA
jgi:membrane-associated phospholipid phosphatase